jgi:hypothetical protein
MTTFKNDQQLLEQYVASFEKLDEMLADELLLPVAWQLALGKTDEAGFKRWRPATVATAPSFLGAIYSKLPAHFLVFLSNCCSPTAGRKLILAVIAFWPIL